MNLGGVRHTIVVAVLMLAGGAMAVFAWVTGGVQAIIFVLLGIAIFGIGVTLRWGKNEHVAYAMFATGVFALFTALARASYYDDLAESLVIAFFALAVVLFVRGWQYYRVTR